MLQEARRSEYKESFVVVARSSCYRIGAGARLTSCGDPSYFLEILLYLCPNSPDIDLRTLRKALAFLEEIEARGYSLRCQDDNCLSCDRTIAPHSLEAEIDAVRTKAEEVFG